jgi:hypothetical protein
MVGAKDGIPNENESRPFRRDCLTTMTTSEEANQKSMTRPRFSVHHTSFLWALCQELVLSTTHRKPALSGADLPFSEIAPIASIKSIDLDAIMDESLLHRSLHEDSLRGCANRRVAYVSQNERNVVESL